MSKEKSKVSGKITPPKCQHCDSGSTLVTGKVIYPHRPDLFGKWYYLCKQCKPWSYVGCHPNSKISLGTCANDELRSLRSAAHRVFDVLWRSGRIRRSHAYEWLAVKLEIKIGDCHISHFGIEQCQKVIQVCSHFGKVEELSWLQFL